MRVTWLLSEFPPHSNIFLEHLSRTSFSNIFLEHLSRTSFSNIFQHLATTIVAQDSADMEVRPDAVIAA